MTVEILDFARAFTARKIGYLYLQSVWRFINVFVMKCDGVFVVFYGTSSEGRVFVSFR